jgi:hypothetical protein
MATVPSASNPKAADYEVANEGADIGIASVVSGRLVIPLVPNAWPPQASIYARDTGRFWRVVEDPIGTPVAAFEGASTLGAPLRGLLFVDAAAPAGGNGAISSPFNSLQAAINSALPNTDIFVAGGTYSEDIVMPNTDRLRVQGAGRGVTILQNVADTHTVNWTRTGALPALAQNAFADLTIRNSAATATNCCVFADGNGESPVFPATNLFGTAGLFFDRVEVIRSGPATGRAAFFRRVTNVQWNDCVWRGEIGVAGAVVTENVSRCTAFGTAFTNVDTQWIRSNPQPFGGRNAFALFAGSGVTPFETDSPAGQGGVILRGHPIFTADSTCVLSGSAGLPAIQGIGLTTIPFGFGPASAPIIGCAATIGLGVSVPGSGTVNLPLPSYAAGVPAPAIDFSRAQFLLVNPAAGAFTVTGASPSLAPHFVSMTQARLIFVTAAGAPVAGAMAVGSVALGINNPVVLDVREATYSGQTIFNVAATSALDRTTWVLTGLTFNVAPTAIPITPAYPSTSYTVTFEPAAPVALGVGAKTVASVTVAASGASTGTMTVTRF